MIHNLFVYGTLKRCASGARLGQAERQRLELEGDWRGEALMAGRIYDMGRYPVLAAPKSEHETVHGEVFRLRSPETTFGWLDIYEGLPPGRARGDEYERVTRHVRLAGGEDLEAWVYVLAGNIGAAALIPDGRWLPH